MDLWEAIRGRRSVRKFYSTDISKDTLLKLIAAACSAPSAGNIQPWKFYVITSEKMKQNLVSAALGQTFLAKAGAVIVVCADLSASSRGYGSRGKHLYAIQDTAAAIENLFLAAHAEGLGCCWVGAFDEAETIRVLNLPPNEVPVAMLPIGKPSTPPRPIAKKSAEEVTVFVD